MGGEAAAITGCCPAEIAPPLLAGKLAAGSLSCRSRRLLAVQPGNYRQCLTTRRQMVTPADGLLRGGAHFSPLWGGIDAPAPRTLPRYRGIHALWATGSREAASAAVASVLTFPSSSSSGREGGGSTVDGNSTRAATNDAH